MPSNHTNHTPGSDPSGAVAFEGASRVSLTKDCEHSEYSAVGVAVWFEIELLENLGARRFDGAFADAELMGDAGVGSSFGHQCKDLAFAGSESFEG